MKRQYSIEFWVGLFMMAGLASLVVLAIQVSGLRPGSGEGGYPLHAYFHDIGGLKERGRVTMAGVVVGRVARIELENETFEAKVTMMVGNEVLIPLDSTASIYTAGLIGDNYIAITPGAEEASMQAGDTFEQSSSALVLERLVGEYIFSAKQ